MSDGYVRVSAKAIWNENEHPEAIDQHPTLELRIELTEYSSRQKMANMLRLLANYVDEGALHPFERPIAEKNVTGEWDDEKQQWILTEEA